MTANDKISLNVLDVMEKNVEQLKGLITNEVEVLNNEVKDRAHIATLWDRPYTGCSPCKPETPE
jgi:hypothetical protein